MTGVAAPIPRTTPRRRVRAWPSPAVMLALIWLVIVLILAVFGTALAPHPPGQQDLFVGLTSSAPGHPLGTDELGRDILSRVMAGTRLPVLGAIAIAVGAMLISVTFGVIAGYRGGRTDAFLMRGVDLMLALPPILIAIVIVGALDGGYVIAVLLLALLFAPWDTRIIRSVALEQRPRAYVEAARVMGLSERRIMVSHILPNTLPLIVVNLCLDFTYGLVTLAGLSFVGIGVGPGEADWGRMLFENRDLLTVNPWAALAPAFMIMLTAAAANIAGDWAYERIEAKGRAK